jgi:hypothetical protein
MAMVLAKSLSPCLTKIIQAQNEFQFKSTSCPIPQSHNNKGEECIFLRRKGFQASSLDGTISDKLSDC